MHHSVHLTVPHTAWCTGVLYTVQYSTPCSGYIVQYHPLHRTVHHTAHRTVHHTAHHTVHHTAHPAVHRVVYHTAPSAAQCTALRAVHPAVRHAVPRACTVRCTVWCTVWCVATIITRTLLQLELQFIGDITDGGMPTNFNTKEPIPWTDLKTSQLYPQAHNTPLQPMSRTHARVYTPIH